jgi:hypothetical protein
MNMLSIDWVSFIYCVRGLKLINIVKNLFFYVEAICNLAIEFNGLVSTKGRQKC